MAAGRAELVSTIMGGDNKCRALSGLGWGPLVVVGTEAVGSFLMVPPGGLDLG